MGVIREKLKKSARFLNDQSWNQAKVNSELHNEKRANELADSSDDDGPAHDEDEGHRKEETEEEKRERESKERAKRVKNIEKQHR